MAKTMAHFVRCNIGTAEMHNSRNEQYIACVNASPKKHYDIFADVTCNNSTWVNPDFAGKTLPHLLDEYRELYRRMVGQAPQEKDRVRQVKNKKTGMTEERTTPGWAPIREGIVPVTAETTAADFRHFAEWLKSKGIEIIRIDIHQDEGHIDPISGERIYNRHAHIIASWIDPETGRTRKLNKEDASRMQDEIAASLGMERGVKKELTGAEHLTHDQYRAKAQAEKVHELTTKNSKLATKNSELATKNSELTTKNSELATKNSELTTKNSELATKNSELTTQNSELTTKNSKLTTQNSEIIKIIRRSCQDLQQFGLETVKSFDKISTGEAAKPKEKEINSRNLLKKESSDDISMLEKNDLLQKSTTIRSLIADTHKAIERIGNRLQKLAAEIPDKKFHFFSSRSQKAQILAIESEKEEEVSNIRAEAEEAVKQAENAKNEAIRQAQAEETKAKICSIAALDIEQAAWEEKKKYEKLNAVLEQKIADAKKEGRNAGYQDGYSDGEAKERANTQAKQKELDDLKISHSTEINELKSAHSSETGDLNKKLNSVKAWREFFRKTNPYLANAEHNWKELKELKEWPLTDDEIIRLFSGKIVEKTHSEMRNYKKIELPVRIEIAESDQGNMRIWYNDTTKEECKLQLKQEVIRKGHGNGLSH